LKPFSKTKIPSKRLFSFAQTPPTSNHQPPTLRQPTKAKIFQEMETLNVELMNAAWAGRIDDFRRLLENGAAVDGKDTYGWTALHKASSYGYLEIVLLLLESGATVDGKNKDKKMALDVAKEKGHSEVVTLLLLLLLLSERE
jgi:ankyrin repeat protein